MSECVLDTPTPTPRTADADNLEGPKFESAAHGLTGRRVAVLAGAAALASLSIDLYLPAFPELARALSATPSRIVAMSFCEPRSW